VLFVVGDIPARSKIWNIKGHNAMFPCSACRIQGVLGHNNHYYYPLTLPHDNPSSHGRTTSYTPATIQRRTGGEMYDIMFAIDFLSSQSRERADLQNQRTVRIPTTANYRSRAIFSWRPDACLFLEYGEGCILVPARRDGQG
jgi:hypothetical protein